MKILNLGMLLMISFIILQPTTTFAYSEPNTNVQKTSEKTRFSLKKKTVVSLASAKTNIASGINGTSEWFIDSEGILHIGSGTLADTPKNQSGAYISPWNSYNGEVTKIIFEGPVTAPTIFDRTFEYFTNLTEIENIAYLDTSQTTSMQRVFGGCSKLTTLDLTSWDTTNVTDIFSLFNGCVNMEYLDVSTWNTRNMTSITYAFSTMSKLKTLDLSNWVLPATVAAQGVFLEDSSLTYLDLSGFNMQNLSGSYFATARFFLNATSLKAVKLSTNFVFNNNNFTNYTSPLLPDIIVTDKYTGKWQNVGTGTISNPKGTDIWTSEEFMTNFDLTPRNDTYVWQPVIQAAADVTVKYVDQEGNEIHEPQTIGGNVGDEYDATTDAYKLAIKGYTLDESKLPENATGALSDTAQTVTYTYTKDPVKAQDVTVKYVDQEGNEVHEPQTIDGNIGDEYDATTDAYKLAIKGYTLDASKLPTNATGTLNDIAQTVIYVYEQNTTPSSTTDSNNTAETNTSATVTPPNTTSESSADRSEKQLPRTGQGGKQELLFIIGGLLLLCSTLTYFVRKKKV